MTISQDLELDITKPLNDVAKIGSQLENMADAAKTSFSDAFSALGSIPPVNVQINDALITQELQAALGAVDTEPLTASIQGAAATADSTVSVRGDTTELVADIDAAAANSEVTVKATADVGTAKDEVEELDDTTQAATSATAGLNDSLGSLADSAQVTGQSLGGLVQKFVDLSPAATAAAAGIIAIASATDSFFQGAVKFESANQRMNKALGDTAPLLKQIDIAGFNTDLIGLTSQVGSGTLALRNSIATFANMGKAAGATGAQVAKSSEELAVLATNAVALNPELGSVGDVADRMQRVLARGGRAASEFGISLTSSEITARALKDTGKETANQLTQFEKSAAGAAIATEKLGPSLKTNIEEASKNPIVQLNKLKLQVGIVRDELGKPLVSPIINVLTTANPATVSLTQSIGALSLVFVNLVGAIVGVVAPIATGFGNALTGVVTIITPLAELIGELIASLGNAAPVITVATVAFLTFTGVLNTNPLLLLVSAIGAAQTAFGGFAPALVAAGAAFLAFTGVLNINPLFLLATAILLAANAVKNWGKEEQKAATNAEQFRVAIFGQAKTLEDIETKLQDLTSATNDYAITQGALSKNADALTALRTAGVGLKELNTQLNAGTRGFDEIVARMVAVNKVKIEVNGVAQTADQIRGMNGNLQTYLATEKAQVTQGESVVVSLQQQSLEYSNAAKAQLDNLVLKGQLTQAEVQEGIQRSLTTNGTGSYAQALQFATEAHKAHQAEIAAGTVTLQGSAAAYVALTQSIALGAIPTEDQLKAVSDKLGISMDQAKQFVDKTKQAIDEFVTSAVSKLPGVSSVFQTLTDKSNPTELTKNLNEATGQILIFGTNLETIRSQGFTKVAEFLTKEGPEAAGKFAGAFLNLTEDQKKALQDAIDTNDKARAAYGDQLRTDIANSTDASKTFAENSTKGFSQGLKFDEVTKESVGKARDALKDEGVIGPIKNEASATGSAIGDGLAFGLVTGFANKIPDLEFQAREAVRRAKEAMQKEAEQRSPSRLFARVAGGWTDGLVKGLDAGTTDVVKQAEAIVRSASSATSGAPLTVGGAGVSGGGVGAGGSVVTKQVVLNLSLPNVPGNPAAAQELGSAVGRGIMSTLDVEALIS